MGRALLVAPAVVVTGLAGAWAFNPDDGAVLRSLPLWRVFGLAAYAGVLGIALIAIGGTVAMAWNVCRARHRSTD